jgi:hypothetical protein
MGRRKSGPHKGTQQFIDDWYAIYPNEKKRQLASKAKITKQIADLERDLARGHTAVGEPISPALADEIRKHIDRLKTRRDLPATKKKIKEVRTAVAEAFVESGLYGKPRGEAQDAETFIKEKLKRANPSVRYGRRRQPRD